MEKWIHFKQSIEKLLKSNQPNSIKKKNGKKFKKGLRISSQTIY